MSESARGLMISAGFSGSVAASDVRVVSVNGGGGAPPPPPLTVTITAPSAGAHLTVGVQTTITFSVSRSGATATVSFGATNLGSAVIVGTNGSLNWTPGATAAAANLVVHVSQGGDNADSPGVSVDVVAGGGFDANTATLKIDTFAADGSWNRPTLGAFFGLTGTANRGRVTVLAPGAGATLNVGGGGGGAGAVGNDVDLSSKTSWAFAGLAGAAANTNATDATFGGTIVVAKGGLSGANGGTGGQASACTGDAKWNGGNGTIIAGNAAGGAGAGSLSAATGVTPGNPEGGYSAANIVGQAIGAGGGSATAAEFSGARGQGSVAYYVAGTSGFPRVQSLPTFTRTTSATPTIVLPDDIQAGDLLIVIVSNDANIAHASDPTGWLPLGTGVFGTIVSGAAFYRFAAGGGADTCVLNLAASTRMNAVAWRVRGAGTPSATFNNADGADASPPSHTLPGGSSKALWLVAVMYDTGGDISAPPANYGDFVFSGATAGNSVHIAAATRYREIDTEDPGAFTATTEQWVGATIGIPPV